MKKVVLTAAALFAFGFANAQEVKFGAKAGLNLSSVKGMSDMKAGFHVGGFAEIKFNEKMALQPELMYSMEGGDYVYDGILFGTAPYSYEQEIKLSKVIMPIMFKYFVAPSFYLEAGPQLDYIVSGKSLTTIKAPGLTAVEDADMDESSQVIVQSDNMGNSATYPATHDFGFKKLNFSFNVGLGYQMASGLFFDGRYNLGLTDFATNVNLLAAHEPPADPTPIDPTRTGESLKSSNIQLSVGYKF